MNQTTLNVKEKFLAILAIMAPWLIGWTPAILIIGYILIKEHGKFVRLTAMKALIIELSVVAIRGVVGVIPQLFDLINTYCSLFEGSGIRVTFLFSLQTAINATAEYASWVLYAIMFIGVILSKEINLGFIGNIANSALGYVNKIYSQNSDSSAFENAASDSVYISETQEVTEYNIFDGDVK